MILRKYLLVVLAAAIVLVVAGFGATGRGPWGQVGFLREVGGLDEAEADGGRPTDTTIEGGPTTSTTYTLEGRDYTRGECITWKVDSDMSRRSSRPVACDEPHLMEVTEAFELDGAGYGEDGPDDQQWQVVIDEECGRRATEHLGYQLDPFGRFRPTALLPTREGWRHHQDRRVICGVQVVSVTGTAAEPELTSYVGRVAGAEQTLLLGTGSCITDLGEPAGDRVVDCAGPHRWEITGTTDLVHGPDTPYPGDDLVTAAVSDACRAKAEAVFGGPMPDHVWSGWYGLNESSWSAGRRVVECILGQAGPEGEWVETVGRLRG